MKTRAPRELKGRPAFTILEIMVSFAILGIIVAAVYSSWMTVVRGSKVGLDAAAVVQRSRTAFRTMEECLSCTVSFASDIRNYAFVAENGDKAYLSFVAKLPSSASVLGGGRFADSLDLRRVTFSVEPGGPDSGTQLVLRQTPILMEMGIDEQEHPIVLEKDVKSFEVEFWDGQAGDWLDEWTQTNQLPQLVRVTLRLGGNRPQSGGVEKVISREIALPSVMVRPAWQPRSPAGPTR